MMRSSAASALRSALQLLFFAFSLWIILASPPAATQAFAGNNFCAAAPVNACGCATCGCGDIGVPRCPTGQELYNDICLPACPQGWQRYPGYPGLCTPPCTHGCPEGWDQVPLPRCPEGFHRDLANPDYCVADFDDSTQDDCPAGMVLSPRTGQCVVDCPEGSYIGENGLCQSYYERECPANYTRDPQTGRCLPPGDWPSGYDWICLPQCPPNYVRDIYQPTRCVPPPPQCPDSFEPYNGRCVPVCDEGTRRDPYGYCVPERCPDGSYPNLRGQCQEPECPQGSDNIRGQCIPSCPQDWSRDENGRCVPPDDDCPQGTEEWNGQCVPVCSEETRRDGNGRCIPTDCADGTERFNGQCVPECPRDTVRDNNGRCIPTGCPDGQVKLNGKCVPRCPAGLTRDSNGRCVCPQGTDNFNGKCVPKCKQGLVRGDNGRCGCPDGLDFVGGRCVPECDQGLVRDKNGRCMPPACPQGTERYQGRCVPACGDTFVRGKNGKCVCPRGTQLGKSGLCVDIPVQRNCPEGFRRNEDGECERIRRVPQGCPDGFVYSKRYQKCIPLDVDDEPNVPTLKRTPTIDPGKLLEQLQPKPKRKIQTFDDGQNDGVNIQKSCPRGFYRDNNGRCVEGKP
ncbi:MAG: hypothetical protein LCH46_03660 [Proteobacteria bacterium]|nr:hypothetical protein [Pseudomonadota bacterium]